MQPLVLILEDNRERKAAMLSSLKRILPRHEVHIFGNASNFLDAYLSAGGNVEFMSLDHDLVPTRPDEDPSDGRQVADRLAANPPTAPIIVHSSNHRAAIGMIRVLQESQWPVWRISPSDGWNWIARDWSYGICELIRKGWIAP